MVTSRVFVVAGLHRRRAPKLRGKYLRWDTAMLREHLLHVREADCVEEIDDYEDLVLNSFSNIYRERTILLWRFPYYREWTSRRVPMGKRKRAPQMARPTEPSLVRVLAAKALQAAARARGSAYDRTMSPEERALLDLGPIAPLTPAVVQQRDRDLAALRAKPYRWITPSEWGFAEHCLRKLDESRILTPPLI